MAGSARPASAQSYGWLDGTISYTYGTNCISGYSEAYSGSYVGYWGANDSSSPYINEVYYVRAVVASIGNPCAGQYGYVEFVLPPNTSLAISSANPVQCYVGLLDTGALTAIEPTYCKQAPVTSLYGGYGFLATPSGGAWPLPQGRFLEIRVPVRSSTALSGMASNSYLYGYAHLIDGNSSPWVTPRQGVFVSASVPSPSITSPAASSVTSSTARLAGRVNSHYTTGTAYFDYGLTTSYGSSDSLSIGGDSDYWDVWDDISSLAPGTTYHWRLRYVLSGGGTYTTSDQTFTTSGARKVKSDFGYDGKSDILWRNPGSGEVWIWTMNGSSVSGSALLGTVGSGWNIVGNGDQTGDGRADILWRNQTTGDLVLWTMNGTSVSARASVGSVSPTYSIVGTGDYSGDGKSDILWRNNVNGEVWLWTMNGAAYSAVTYVATVPTAYAIVRSGDVNLDGKFDIIWRNEANGEVWIWTMNGATATAKAYVGNVADANYKVAGVADFDGDGKADILWRHATTGVLYLWRMNGTAILSIQYVGAVDPVWLVAATNDYNGDGMADILWRNGSGGQLYRWQMNGASVSSVTSISTVGLGYQVQNPK